MHLFVLGFVRNVPSSEGRLGSVEFLTHVGRITLDGTELSYVDETQTALFKEKGVID